MTRAKPAKHAVRSSFTRSEIQASTRAVMAAAEVHPVTITDEDGRPVMVVSVPGPDAEDLALRLGQRMADASAVHFGEVHATRSSFDGTWMVHDGRGRRYSSLVASDLPRDEAIEMAWKLSKEKR